MIQKYDNSCYETFVREVGGAASVSSPCNTITDSHVARKNPLWGFGGTVSLPKGSGAQPQKILIDQPFQTFESLKMSSQNNSYGNYGKLFSGKEKLFENNWFYLISCKNKKTGRFLRERGTSGHDFDYVGAQPPLDTPRGVNYSEKRRTGFRMFWVLGIFCKQQQQQLSTIDQRINRINFIFNQFINCFASPTSRLLVSFPDKRSGCKLRRNNGGC